MFLQNYLGTHLVKEHSPDIGRKRTNVMKLIFSP